MRQEIVEALGRPDLKVFPLLVDDASMPSPAKLPDLLKPLARRQAYELTLRHWAKDVDVLAAMLKRIPVLAGTPTSPGATQPSAPTECFDDELIERRRRDVERARSAADDVRQRAEAEAERKAQEERQRAEAAARATSPETHSADAQGAQPGAASLPWKQLAAAAAGVIAVIGFVVLSSDKKPPASGAAAESTASAPAVSVPARSPQAGETFRDCDECPEMVKIPADSFTMGSLPDEKGREDDEGPQHPVRFARPFAVGKYEVTFQEWDACRCGEGLQPSAG